MSISLDEIIASDDIVFDNIIEAIIAGTPIYIK